MAGILPIPTIPTSPSLFNSAGIPLGKLPLQLLTLFPPTGYLGLNLSAVGLPITALIKAATYGAGIAAGLYANRLYISQVAQILSYILIFAPPWYIFDCIQILIDTKFDINGFILPLPVPAIPSGGGKEGKWTLTLPLLSLILAATSFSALAFIKEYLPENLINSFGKYIGYGALGGGILFSAVGLIGLLMQKPGPSTGVQEAAVPGAGLLGGLPGAGLLGGVPGAGLLGGVPGAGLLGAAQSGGGSAIVEKLPPLSSFVENFQKQTGGGSNRVNEAIPFIGVLALIVLGGFSLSFLRSKQNSTI